MINFSAYLYLEKGSFRDSRFRIRGMLGPVSVVIRSVLSGFLTTRLILLAVLLKLSLLSTSMSLTNGFFSVGEPPN